MAASSSGRSPWMLWPAPSTPTTVAVGLAAQQLGDVVVVDDGPGQPADEQDGHGEPGDRLPPVAELGVDRFGGLGAEARVAPDPAAVLALDRVVQDAAPQGGLRAARVVLDRAGQQLVEAVEAGRAVDEVGDRRRLLRRSRRA